MSNYTNLSQRLTYTGQVRSRMPRLRLKEAGLTLVELLVALTLGLILLAGVINIFMTTRQTFRVNENLGHMQENSRMAFELLVREIRESGSTPCGTRAIAMGNVLRVGGNAANPPPWWANWAFGTLRGFEGGVALNPFEVGLPPLGTTNTDRVVGTDAILSLRISSDDSKIKHIASHSAAPTNTFTVTTSVGYSQGDLAAVCDLETGALFQIGSTSTFALGYQQSAGAAADLNCAVNLAYTSATPLIPCTPDPKTFLAGSVVAGYDPVFWYIGINPRRGKSLYRIHIKNGISEPQEMIPFVEDMQIDYLTRDETAGDLLATVWVAANDDAFNPSLAARKLLSPPLITGWEDQNMKQAVAVRIKLTLISEDIVGSNNAPLKRTFVAVAALRARDLP